MVDRAVIEHLFELRRRRAIDLLHRFGGYPAGRTFLVDRSRLIDHLRSLAQSEDVQVEVRRRERLDHKIDQLRRQQAAARVRIPVQADVRNRNIAALSAGIALEPGHLHIEFAGAQDLLAKLYELCQAASNDFDRFRGAAEPAK